ncbi:DUF6152 family protein [Advenella mimigardefordensis]|uniref:Uncharacterized protein n=1 Tax=Advenella mimigardefordensis (strain DSM 17166 / LMG 22922 / DPN7) TaxID=1247726 RepID=W0PAS4_ADVMD|nr:DUF6152 family protein [Advenella mimigardefordensis]AHG62520.1 hypothetical protein MIM_c04180 [Advenella mimigardefordensis DPN7]
MSLKFITSIAAFVLALVSIAPASAHHGWSSFDTRHAYYAAGTITQVRWGNPHSEVRFNVERTALPDGWLQRELPQGADATNGRATMESARPYAGEHKELRLILAGPSWMERWGLNRPLEKGETIEVVGYLNSGEDEELRPMMFWLANGQGVWQQLTALPRAPEPASKATP